MTRKRFLMQFFLIVLVSELRERVSWGVIRDIINNRE